MIKKEVIEIFLVTSFFCVFFTLFPLFVEFLRFVSLFRGFFRCGAWWGIEVEEL